MRIAITGLGIVHPHGEGVVPLADAFEHHLPPPSRSLIDRGLPPAPPTTDRAARRMDRLGQLACRAALLALLDAGVASPPEPTRTALIAGTAFGALESVAAFHRELVLNGPETVNPVHFANTAHNVAAAQAAIQLTIRGPVLTLASGTAAGLDALAAGARLLLAGRADLVLAGGYDLWVPELETALSDAGLLAVAADGAGLRPAEAACFLVLESAAHARARGARPRGLLAGYGQASDVPRAAAPGADSGLARAMTRALASAGRCRLTAVAPGFQGWPAYDARVDAAYRTVLARRWDVLPRLLPKEILGETFGAAGPLAVAAVLAAFDSARLPRGAVLIDGLSWGGAATAVVVRPPTAATRSTEGSL